MDNVKIMAMITTLVAMCTILAPVQGLLTSLHVHFSYLFCSIGEYVNENRVQISEFEFNQQS